MRWKRVVSQAKRVERNSGASVQDISVGVDVIEISRVAATLARFGDRFLSRIYTESEIAYCRGRAPQLAARFAAKEAVMKALGTGTRGVGWREVEVTRARSGAPSIALHGRAAARARTLGIDRLAVSLSHSREYAVASVVGRVADGRVTG
jgi:holo-[acyl-carrier protein] synthase